MKTFSAWLSLTVKEGFPSSINSSGAKQMKKWLILALIVVVAGVSAAFALRYE